MYYFADARYCYLFNKSSPYKMEIRIPNTLWKLNVENTLIYTWIQHIHTDNLLTIKIFIRKKKQNKNSNRIAHIIQFYIYVCLMTNVYKEMSAYSLYESRPIHPMVHSMEHPIIIVIGPHLHLEYLNSNFRYGTVSEFRRL